MFQMKEQDKTQEEKLSEMEVSNLPNNQFKVMITKMLNELRRRMDEQSEKFNKELENMNKNKTEMKNILTEIKNTLKHENFNVS